MLRNRVNAHDVSQYRRPPGTVEWRNKQSSAWRRTRPWHSSCPPSSGHRYLGLSLASAQASLAARDGTARQPTGNQSHTASHAAASKRSTPSSCHPAQRCADSHSLATLRGLRADWSWVPSRAQRARNSPVYLTAALKFHGCGARRSRDGWAGSPWRIGGESPAKVHDAGGQPSGPIPATW
jgi:hypothetical protein